MQTIQTMVMQQYSSILCGFARKLVQLRSFFAALGINMSKDQQVSLYLSINDYFYIQHVIDKVFRCLSNYVYYTWIIPGCIFVFKLFTNVCLNILEGFECRTTFTTIIPEKINLI